MRNCHSNVHRGSGKLVVRENTQIYNMDINIFGSNNKIFIGKNVKAQDLTIWMEDDNNTIIIHDNTTIHGATKLACIEGTKIEIGEDCMFSSNIDITTGDSHSIVDRAGVRINSSKDITIGKHVWIGKKVSILKGVKLPDNSIIGACSVVNKEFAEDNVVIAGTPARIVKRNINWLRERI